MLHKNAVIFAVVSHICCKPIALTFLRLFCGDRAGKSALSRRGFIEKTAVLGRQSSARYVDLGFRRDLDFAKCIVLAQCMAGFCGVFYRDQVGFVLYYRCLPVNPSAHGVVLRFDMEIFWRR